MAALVALGIMSVTWMAVVTTIVVAQKLLPLRATVDVPLALAIVGLGAVIEVVPTLVEVEVAVPRLTPAIW
jgi:predicted metal-binding membrane protein